MGPQIGSLTRAALVNAGSRGKPRDVRGGSTFVRVHWDPDAPSVETVPVAYRVDVHLESIARSPLSEGTSATTGGVLRVNL